MDDLAGLADILSAVGTAVDEGEISGVVINGADLPSQNTYFSRLTAGQIISLAENGARLSYVGSGKGNVDNIEFDTPEGIGSYVELNGDNYVFQGDEIRAYPDMIEEIIKPSLPTG